MRKCLKLALPGALLGAMTATAIPTEVLAGPVSVASPSVIGLSAPVDEVGYRRWGGGGRYYGGYYRRANPGAAIAAGVGLGLLGAGLAASSSGYYGGYYPYYNYGSYPYDYGYSYGYPSYWGW